MINWDEYFAGFARHAATKSKDSTQVGCVIVGPNKEIRMTGFNGPPSGVLDSPARRERPTKYLFASHAEQNAIAFAARNGVALDGCTMYVTHHPCVSCTKSIIQAGIVCVYVLDGKLMSDHWGEEEMAARTMLSEAGVTVVNSTKKLSD